ncbi:MAG: energy transducer TonB [Bacteroidales bacterium]|jgi:hypothetical protein
MIRNIFFCLIALNFTFTLHSQDLKVKTTKYQNGAISETYQVTARGKLQGNYKRFYPEGQLNIETSFSDNQPAGAFVSRHPNGHIAVSGMYIGGRKEGQWTYAGPDSLMTVLGNFTNDLMEGVWIYTHPDGFRMQVTYKSGKPDGPWELLSGDTLLASCRFTDGKPDRYSMTLPGDSVYRYQDSLYRAPEHTAQFALLSFSNQKNKFMIIPGEPRFIIGPPAISQYLADFVNVPPSAYPAYNATGTIRNSCFVQMTVSPFGTIDEVKILQGFSIALEQEIIRQVKKMPLWIPAINRNIPVSTIMTMKYTFRTLMIR